MLPALLVLLALISLQFVVRKNWTLGLPAFLIVLLTIVGPILWALFISFTSYGVYQERPLFAGFDNYLKILEDSGFKLSLKLTALWSFLRTSLEISLSFLLALKLRKSSRTGRLALLLLALGWFVPSFITVSGWRAFIQGYGGYSLLNIVLGTGVDLTLNPAQAFLATLLVSVWLSIPFSTMIIVGMLGRVSGELDDMMRLDGAGDFASATLLLGEIRHLMVPYALFQLARATKEFTSVFLLSGNGPLLPEGFTPQTLVGSTSFAGVVLFRKFAAVKDYGLLSAYAVFAGGFAILWILGAVFSRNSVPKRHRQILFLSAVAHLFLGAYTGWSFWFLVPVTAYSLLPFTIPRHRRFFRLTVGALIIYEIIMNVVKISLEGVSGIVPASFLSFPLILLSMRYRFPSIDFTLSRWLKSSLLILSLLPTVFLVAYILLLSFSVEGEIIPSLNALTAANYPRVIGDGLLNTIFNTLKTALWCFAIILGTIIPLAYLFATKKGFLAKATSSLVLLGSLYTGMHTLLPLYFIFRGIGLTDSFFGVALVVTVQSAPLALLVLGGFFASVPRELREISRLDGLSGTGYLWRILFPLSLPVVGGVLTYVLVSCWSSFTLPLIMLNRSEMMPFSLKVFSYAGEIRSYYTSWNLFAAASVIGTVPLLLLFRIARSMIYSPGLGDRGVGYD
ncbi:MAG: ABC transporter permease subunit [Mesotoga sp.]|nr:ABC transporter permease subunit [Mesotoga sp.]HPI17579.1 ABC transporter permease subunit [Mesotoga sp.]